VMVICPLLELVMSSSKVSELHGGNLSLATIQVPPAEFTISSLGFTKRRSQPHILIITTNFFSFPLNIPVFCPFVLWRGSLLLLRS
jgi:hypothetical protein